MSEEWVSLMGEDVTLRRVNEGEGSFAEMGIVVCCEKIVMRTIDTEIIIDLISELRAEIGKGDVVPGLELALRNSRPGDHLRVRIQPKFAWGLESRIASSLELPSLPPNSAVEYELHVLKHTSAEREYPDDAERQCLFSALLRKDAGNNWFKFGEYARAGRAYSEGVELAEGAPTGDPSGEVAAELRRVRRDCLNNLAAAHLGSGEMLKARATCIRVLEDDPRNVKALLRAAKASLGLSEYDECELCLDRAEAMDPMNAALTVERQRLAHARKRHREQLKAMSKKMHSKLFPKTARDVEPTAAVETVAAPKEAGAGERSLLLIGTSVAVLAISLAIAYYLAYV